MFALAVPDPTAATGDRESARRSAQHARPCPLAISRTSPDDGRTVSSTSAIGSRLRCAAGLLKRSDVVLGMEGSGTVSRYASRMTGRVNQIPLPHINWEGGASEHCKSCQKLWITVPKTGAKASRLTPRRRGSGASAGTKSVIAKPAARTIKKATRSKPASAKQVRLRMKFSHVRAAQCDRPSSPTARKLSNLDRGRGIGPNPVRKPGYHRLIHARIQGWPDMYRIRAMMAVRDREAKQRPRPWWDARRQRLAASDTADQRASPSVRSP